MEMIKKIKSYGNTAVIQINKEDLKLNNLKIGDIVKIQITKDEKSED